MPEERKNYIISMLQKDGKVSVPHLADFFNVTFQTVRRDLDRLEKEGIVKKVYGGAILNNEAMQNFSHAARVIKYNKQKDYIADLALRFIDEGDLIALNDSTTNISIANKIKNIFKSLSIVTNSLAIVNQLSDVDNYNIILTGGVLNAKHQAFYGELAENMLGSFAINKAFISVSSVSLKNGFTDYPVDEVNILKKLIEISEKVILLADSSKFETTSLIKVADLNCADLIITDSGVNPDLLENYRKYVDVVYE